MHRLRAVSSLEWFRCRVPRPQRRRCPAAPRHFEVGGRGGWRYARPPAIFGTFALQLAGACDLPIVHQGINNEHFKVCRIRRRRRLSCWLSCPSPSLALWPLLAHASNNCLLAFPPHGRTAPFQCSFPASAAPAVRAALPHSPAPARLEGRWEDPPLSLYTRILAPDILLIERRPDYPGAAPAVRTALPRTPAPARLEGKTGKPPRSRCTPDSSPQASGSSSTAPITLAQPPPFAPPFRAPRLLIVWRGRRGSLPALVVHPNPRSRNPAHRALPRLPRRSPRRSPAPAVRAALPCTPPTGFPSH
ncbi:hypothetical protein DFH09DRAFT_1408445 [Mycena vulgaris]|nr:hypothetical protein DFH09DRAFT_1408445 [Mycena vulgaris]